MLTIKLRYLIWRKWTRFSGKKGNLQHLQHHKVRSMSWLKHMDKVRSLSHRSFCDWLFTFFLVCFLCYLQIIIFLISFKLCVLTYSWLHKSHLNWFHLLNFHIVRKSQQCFIMLCVSLFLVSSKLVYTILDLASQYSLMQ